MKEVELPKSEKFENTKDQTQDEEKSISLDNLLTNRIKMGFYQYALLVGSGKYNNSI